MALRPRFEVELSCSSREAITRLCTYLESCPVAVRRTRVPGGGGDRAPRDEDHVVITVPTAQTHFWSPWLTIELSPRETGTRVQAQFSPHPSVWTGFAFGYLSLGLILTVALAIGGSGALLPGGEQPWAWWVAGGAAVAMLGMWWASQVGQRLAHQQMELLRAELERAVEACRAPGA